MYVKQELKNTHINFPVGEFLLMQKLGEHPLSTESGATMGGTDISLGRISGALAGASHWNKNIQIEKAAKRDKLQNAATALRAQYGFGDGMQRAQLESILKGDTVLAKRGGKGSDAETVTKDGTRTVYLDNYKETMSREEKLAMGITLGHEAYRDGLVGSEQQQFMETTRAVIGHTEMALRMQADKRYSESMDSIIAGSAILQKDIAAYKSGDLMTMLSHVAGNYDYSKDYWKLMEDGSLAYDGDGWLKDSNGNQIYDEDGNPMGALGIETGLRKILKVGETEARLILRNSHFIADEDSGTPWKNELNEDRRITLNNSLYAEKYNEHLFYHNTLNIYNQLVDVGLMDYHSVDYDIEQYSGNDWNGRQPDVKYISYKEWKANNFISSVSKKMISLKKPVNARISSPYGKRIDPIKGKDSFHTGIDWAVAEGTGFYPFATGKVSSIYTSDKLGNVLTLEHKMTYTFKGRERTTSFFSEYMHMQNNSTGEVRTPYSIGDTILKNTIAGYSGGTGSYLTAPHLHAGVYFTSLKDNPYANWLYMQGDSSKSPYTGNYYIPPYLFY